MLGTSVPNRVLPCKAVCPIGGCGGDLTVYDDHNASGEWFHCRTCEFAGDQIELASACWSGTDPRHVILKLHACGFEIPAKRLEPAIVERHVKYHLVRRRLTTELWEQSRRRLLADNSKTLRHLQRKFGIRLDVDPDTWLTGPGLFIGGTDRKSVENIYKPGALYSTLRNDGTGKSDTSGGETIFKGPGWTDLLTIPFHDMPGRIKGLMFLGREGRQPADIAFKVMNYAGSYEFSAASKAIVRSIGLDCGVAMRDASRFADDYVFVMNEPVIAVRMQCWHMQDSKTPAPLVSAYTRERVSTATKNWRTFDEPLLFWGQANAALLKHAKAANSKISTVGFNTKGPLLTFMHTRLSEWLPRVRASARAWPDVLEELLGKLPTGEAEDLLLGMELEPEDLKQFLAVCPDELQDRLAPLLEKTKIRTVLEDQEPISEGAYGWMNEKTHELVSSAVLRIHRMLHVSKSNNPICSGEIIHAGSSVPFVEDEDVIEAGAFRWMRRQLLAANAGNLVFDRRYENRVTALAAKFHPPTVVSGLEKVGWNRAESAYVFPAYVLRSNGDVEEDSRIVMTGRRLPCAGFEKPTVLTDDDMRELTAESTGPIWAVAVHVIAYAIAPLFGHERRPVVLADNDDGTLTNAASAFGCPFHPITDNVSDVRAYMELSSAEHNWPFVVKLASRGSVDDWLDGLEHVQAAGQVVVTNRQAALALAAFRGWRMIDAGAPAIVSASWGKVVPLFLQHMAADGNKLGAGKTQLERVLRTVADWFASVGGGSAVLWATKFTRFDLAVCDRVGIAIDLLCDLSVNGRLSAVETDGAVFVDKAQTMKAFVAHKVPVSNLGNVSSVLLPAGRVVTTPAPGWLIDRKQWSAGVSRLGDDYGR